MKDICIIDGREWNVIITDISESFSILYGENTGRSLGVGCPMVLDPLGSFFNYKVTFSRKRGYEEEYDELFDFLSVPRSEGVEVNIIHGQALWSEPFMAYVSQGERSIKRIDPNTKKVYWDKFTANIVPMEAQVLPE